ncbi:MAG: hypothetical protein A2W11_13875 [Ignavibacteria bacterium RBG_16_35_7]|nr:MAG: hypothetical protein A2W11_13875 [Ignavibacteria bacterium RBG_16_35_7]
MKKHLLFFALFLAFFTTKAFSQWPFEGIFPLPDTLRTSTGVQFVAVDPDGKVWLGPHNTPGDSIFVPDSSKYKKVIPLYVYNADGSIWDTIKAVTIGGTFYPLYGNGYGLNRALDGNILYCDGSVLYKINYQTGEGMARVAPAMGSLCSPAVAGNGNVYVAPVLPGGPI